MDDALKKCEEEVAELKDENRNLRDAARTFGDLADRLNAMLVERRRNSGDRRAAPRATFERRTPQSKEGDNRAAGST